MGFVTLGHSGRKSARTLGLDMERRPGIHPPILTEDVFQDAVAGVEGRRTGVSKPKKQHRMYLLAGRLFCRCGARMRGEPRISKAGRLYRYYACPVSDKRGVKPNAAGDLMTCDQKRVPAEEAEAAVLERLATGVLRAEAIDAAREDLRTRLKAPKPGLSDQKRKRLQTHLQQIAKRFDWGEMPDDEYLREKEATERELVMLPDSDKLVLFDGQRKVITTMAENLSRATPEQRREFVLLFVERALAYDREVRKVQWTGPARPFFKDSSVLQPPGRVRGDREPPDREPGGDEYQREILEGTHQQTDSVVSQGRDEQNGAGWEDEAPHRDGPLLSDAVVVVLARPAGLEPTTFRSAT